MGLEMLKYPPHVVKHWARIRLELWINRVWDEAHEMNEYILIQRDNEKAAAAAIKSWRENNVPTQSDQVSSVLGS